MKKILFVAIIILFYSNFANAQDFKIVSRNPAKLTLEWKLKTATQSILTIGEPDMLPALPKANVKYEADIYSGMKDNSIVVPGQKVLAISKDKNVRVEITNLSALTAYRIAIFTLQKGKYTKFIDTLITTSYSHPTQTAKNIEFPYVSHDSLEISSLFGNGAGRLVLMSEGKPCEVNKIELKEYTGSQVFGKGDRIGDHTYVVRNFIGNYTKVGNLKPDTEYHCHIVEYLGSGDLIQYNTDKIKSNPLVVRTLLKTPISKDAELLGGHKFSAKFELSTNATYGLLEVATDSEFRYKIKGLESIKVQNTNSYQVEVPDHLEKVFYRIKSYSSNNSSQYSDVIAVRLK